MADIFALFIIAMLTVCAVTIYTRLRTTYKELERQRKRTLQEADIDYIRKIEAATTVEEIDRLVEERKKKQLCSGLSWPSSCLSWEYWRCYSAVWHLTDRRSWAGGQVAQ